LRAYEKQTILDEVVFILFLCYITVTCRHTIVFYGKDCFSNIKTSSKRMEYLNIFNTTFKNISVTTFVAEIGVPREIHRPVASH
jgi:hypothetical protein